MVKCYSFKPNKKELMENSTDRRDRTIGFTKSWYCLWLVISIIVFTLFYVVQTNARATKGFGIKDLEGQLEFYNDENHKLEIEVSKMESMVEIEPKVKELNMVRCNEVVYYDPVSAQFAKK